MPDTLEAILAELQKLNAQVASLRAFLMLSAGCLPIDELEALAFADLTPRLRTAAPQGAEPAAEPRTPSSPETDE
jgi:hypothetical protein